MSTKCYDLFGCKKQECIMFDEGEKRDCWDVEPTLTPCTKIFKDSIKMQDKIVFCKNCLFYELVNKSIHTEFNFTLHQ